LLPIANNSKWEKMWIPKNNPHSKINGMRLKDEKLKN